MRLVVCDASFLIDLLQADIFPAFLRLNYEKYAPPSVVREVKEKNRQLLEDSIETKQIKKPRIENIDEIVLLNKKYSSLSFQDSACLFIAIKFNSMLLTCEGPLRKIAMHEYGLEVHGSLFIFDELLKERLITYRMAHERLIQLMDSGAYLPINECHNRLRRWKRKF